MNCPDRGKVTEKGSVRAESYVGGIERMQEKRTRSLRPESVVDPNAMGFCLTVGRRCPDRRLIALSC